MLSHHHIGSWSGLSILTSETVLVTFVFSRHNETVSTIHKITQYNQVKKLKRKFTILVFVFSSIIMNLAHP